MLLLNAVVLSVIVMLALSLARVHVVISLFVASLVGGLEWVSRERWSLSKPAWQEARKSPFPTRYLALLLWRSLTQAYLPCSHAQL